MISVHTAILGTDPWGVSTADYLLDQSNDVALIGELSSRDQYNTYLDNLGQHTPYEGKTTLDTDLDRLDEGRFLGGQLFDLQTSNGHFYCAVNKHDELTTVLANQLIVTAPAGTDLVAKEIHVPGEDSAVTGLVIETCDIELEATDNRWTIHPDLLSVESGFENAAEDNLRVIGPAQFGVPDDIQSVPPNMDTDSTTVAPPSQTEPEGFFWEDESMPEGFVDTKTNRLRTLMEQVLIDTPSSDLEPLVQEIEGLAGEIDSYSRFRQEPGLRRLRWKMLTAMNFIRPYLVETPKPTS